MPRSPSAFIGARTANEGPAAANGRRHLRSVVSTGLSADGSRAGGLPPALGWPAVGLALVMAVSPLATAYFDFNTWGALALALMIVLVVVARFARIEPSRRLIAAFVGLAGLLALSAASMLWAESKESAWMDTNRLALYVVVFAIALLTIRDRRTGRMVMLVLGSAALLTSLWLCISFLLGGDQSSLLTRRLNAPIGYINGTAGLLVMGIWPWVASAEAASRRIARAGALAGASLIAGMSVLTQSRAVVPAMVLSVVLVLVCAPGRTRRAINLLLLGGAVAAGLPWTLAVYSTGGLAARNTAPTHGLLRAAAVAILVPALGSGVIRLALSRLAGSIEPDRLTRLMHRAGRALAVVAVVIVGAGVVIGAPWISREYRAFTSLQVNESATNRFIDASGFRYDLWRVALHEFRQQPLRGLGAGNYDVEYYRLRKNPQYVVQPHSLEMQMAAELGIGGVIALLLFCGAIFSGCWARRETLAAGDPLIKIAAAGLFMAWLADTSVDWLYDIPGLTGMALIAGAALVAPAARGGREERRGRWGQAALVGGLAALGLVAASVGRQYAGARYQDAAAAKVAHSPKSAIRTLRTAAKLDPDSLSILYSLAAAYARENDYQRARGALLVAESLEPHNYVPPALLGDLAVRRGDLALAAAEYRRALYLNPRDPGLLQAVQNAAGGRS